MFTLLMHVQWRNFQHRPATDLLHICWSTPVHVFQTTADSTGIRLPGKYRKDNKKYYRDKNRLKSRFTNNVQSFP